MKPSFKWTPALVASVLLCLLGMFCSPVVFAIGVTFTIVLLILADIEKIEAEADEIDEDDL